MLLKLTFLILGIVVLASGGVINDDRVKNYEEFLRKSVTGEPLKSAQFDQDEWENSGKFEGDIILTEEQIKSMVEEYSGKRNSLIDTRYHWPNRIVIYDYAAGHFTAAQIQAIENALRVMESQSCLRFRRRQNENNYVRVTGTSGGCFSYVGYIGGAQQLNLALNTPGVGCFRQGVIIHEFLHAVGVYHQQSTHNRDAWVRIVWDKIIPGTEHNFAKYASNVVTNFDVEYDYGSIMHYHEWAFSVDGSKTIVALKQTDETIGQDVRMSKGDIRKLNLMYKC